METFVHAAEWMDGATMNRHQPQARLYAAAKVRQLRIFYSSSSPHAKVQGGQRRCARVKAERWRESEEAGPVLDSRSAKSAAASQQPGLAPVATLAGPVPATPSFAKTSLINQILSTVAGWLPHYPPATGPEVLETHNGDASMAPKSCGSA